MSGANFPGSHDTAGEALRFVGQRRISDDELEQHIADCGRRMEAAYARFEQSGKGADRAEAGRWRNAMQQAIAEREKGCAR